MITSSSISYITQMLNEPHKLSAHDKQKLSSLLNTYPYFVPARYLQAALQYKESGNLPGDIELYRSNWVLFSEFLERAQKNEEMKEDTPLIQPIYTEDYFKHEGIDVSNDIPGDINHPTPDVDASLMVVMSFAEWLAYFKTQSQKAKQEAEGQKALKSMWQKEKLAAAMQEENEEIPEEVFEMAMNSISNEEDLASEPLAEIYIKQGKYDKAIEMYKKLSLRNPQKSAYFARKIESVLNNRS